MFTLGELEIFRSLTMCTQIFLDSAEKRLAQIMFTKEDYDRPAEWLKSRQQSRDR